MSRFCLSLNRMLVYDVASECRERETTRVRVEARACVLERSLGKMIDDKRKQEG